MTGDNKGPMLSPLLPTLQMGRGRGSPVARIQSMDLEREQEENGEPNDSLHKQNLLFSGIANMPLISDTIHLKKCVISVAGGDSIQVHLS